MQRVLAKLTLQGSLAAMCEDMEKQLFLSGVMLMSLTVKLYGLIKNELEQLHPPPPSLV